MDERTLAILADIGLLTLRIMFAWIFLWPLPGLLKDWQTTVQTTGLLFPFGQRFFTTVSVSWWTAPTLRDFQSSCFHRGHPCRRA